jgi:hypothetical protein
MVREEVIGMAETLAVEETEMVLELVEETSEYDVMLLQTEAY